MADSDKPNNELLDLKQLKSIKVALWTLVTVFVILPVIAGIGTGVVVGFIALTGDDAYSGDAPPPTEWQPNDGWASPPDAGDGVMEDDLEEGSELLAEMTAVKASPKVAGPDKPAQPAKPDKPDKVYKILPGIDLSKFTAKQKTTILERANKERCPCGCKLTVAGCRNDDSSCGTGKKLANKIVEEVTGVAPAAPKDKDIGKPLDIKFTATDGSKVDLAKMKGKVVLIDFWATWCGPCVAELPNVKKAYAKLHPKGFEIVGISLDSSEDKLKKFIKDREMPWPQYFDGQGWKNKISTRHGIRSIPAMWLVDKEGNLVDKNARRGLEAKVEKLLAAKVAE